MQRAAQMGSPTLVQTLPSKPAITTLLGLSWLAAIAFSLRLLFNYETTPGPFGVASASWPSESKIKCSTDRLTLVMLAHPRCPCSRASVGELARIMAQAPGKMSAYVLFFEPKDGWSTTDLQRTAAAIPGVTVLSDVDGVEAARFGAETSGHTFLFDRDGDLLFSGGITGSRGHNGDNAGERAIISLAREQARSRVVTFVFGCRLANPVVGDRAR